MPTVKLSARVVSQIQCVPSGQVLYRDADLQGFGLRVGTKTMTYFAEKRVAGRTVRHSLGIHGQITPDQARKAAQVALGEMTGGADLNADKKAGKKARADHQSEKSAAARYTLGALCDQYVKHLRKGEKVSASDVENVFKNYVKGSEFENTPAREFTSQQAAALSRKLIELRKGRTAAKLRSFLRAAYALAQGAEGNADAPAEMMLFGIETNPVAATSALSRFNKVRDVVMSEAELGEFARLLDAALAEQYDDALAAIKLSVLLGGQRIAQVLRLTAADVNLDSGTVTIYDPKGRRKEPRRHVLPLVDDARTLIEKILEHRRADWLFGDKNASTTPDTVARKGRDLMETAQKNIAGKGKHSNLPVNQILVRDLRRTAETMMAAMGISKDLRAQIQSHGLGGVQDRHYDRHDYMDEKRNALVAWNAKLKTLKSGKPVASNVRKLKRA